MKLYLGGYFAYFLSTRQNWIDVELNGPARLSEVLAGLGIPAGEIYLAVVNGELVDLQEAFVSERDEVRLFPAIGGG